MKHCRFAFASVAVILVLWATPAHAQRVLFVGNSLIGYNDMPATFQHLAESTGKKPYVEEYIWYGQSLKTQYGRADLQTALMTKKWDFVVLQDYSTEALKVPDVFDKSVADFDKLAKAAGAKTLLIENWALKGQSTLPGIEAAYTKAAQPVGGTLVPLALAWNAVNTKSTINLYRDTKHPTPIATFMAACVLFGTIYAQSPATLPHEGVMNVPRFANGKYGGVPNPRDFVNLDTVNPPADVKFVQSVAVDLFKAASASSK